MKQFIVILILTASASSLYAQLRNQPSSLFFKSEQTMREQAVRGSQGGNNEASDDYSMINGMPRVNAGTVSWTIVEETEVKGISVHDLITITIREKSTHGSQADNKSSKDDSLSFALTNWLHLTGGELKPATMNSGPLTVDSSYSKTLDGKSEISREDYMTAEIQAEVVDVYPNGNVLLEANHFIRTDDETTTITLTGMCRSNDINSSNVIMSDRIANLKIDKQHSGIARDYTKRGWLSGIIDFISPF